MEPPASARLAAFGLLDIVGGRVRRGWRGGRGGCWVGCDVVWVVEGRDVRERADFGDMAVACDGWSGEGRNFGGRLAFGIEMAVMVEGERVDELGVDAAVSQSVVSLACYSGFASRRRILVISFKTGVCVFTWSLARQR